MKKTSNWTEFIRELLNSGGKVTLFTRLRRFGKNLNISNKYVKIIFEIGTNTALFNGLEIADKKSGLPLLFI